MITGPAPGCSLSEDSELSDGCHRRSRLSVLLSGWKLRPLHIYVKIHPSYLSKSWGGGAQNRNRNPQTAKRKI